MVSPTIERCEATGVESALAARIGPNAVIQTLRALDELEPAYAAEVAGRANVAALSTARPDGLIPEAWFVRLVCATRAVLSEPRAEAVLRRAGELTADYVAAHRIPRLIRWLLGALPAVLSIPLLLSAFRAHAWTFAGSGRFEVQKVRPPTILLTGSPTCRAASRTSNAGAYYEAAFEGLLRLADPAVAVREVTCAARGARQCCFEIEIGSKPEEGVPCASS